MNGIRMIETTTRRIVGLGLLIQAGWKANREYWQKKELNLDKFNIEVESIVKVCF